MRYHWDINHQQRLESKETYIRPPHCQQKVHKNSYKHSLRYNYSIFFKRVFFFPFWFGHRRRCGRHHISDHFGRTDPIFYAGTQVKVRIHLDTRLTRSGLISLVPSVGIAFRIEIRRSSSHQLLYSNGVQPRFCSPGSTDPGTCGHRRRTY